MGGNCFSCILLPHTMEYNGKECCVFSKAALEIASIYFQLEKFLRCKNICIDLAKSKSWAPCLEQFVFFSVIYVQ